MIIALDLKQAWISAKFYAALTFAPLFVKKKWK